MSPDRDTPAGSCSRALPFLGEKLFLTLRWNFLWFNLRPLLLVLSLDVLPGCPGAVLDLLEHHQPTRALPGVTTARTNTHLTSLQHSPWAWTVLTQPNPSTSLIAITNDEFYLTLLRCDTFILSEHTENRTDKQMLVNQLKLLLANWKPKKFLSLYFLSFCKNIPG